jgi:hypothetical protein
MISENEYMVNRDKEFNLSKYIVVARLEKARGRDSNNLD